MYRLRKVVVRMATERFQSPRVQTVKELSEVTRGAAVYTAFFAVYIQN